MSKKQRFNPKEDEHIWAIPAALATFISVGGVIYTIYLKAIGVISDNVLVLYAFSFWFPFSIAVCFGTYEVLFSVKIKKPFLFHLKRFLFRMTVIFGYMLCFIAFWSLLSPLTSWKSALLLTLILTSMTLAMLVAIPKTRKLIKKFTEGE